MVTQKNRCIDREELKLFLNEQVPPNLEQQIVIHLEQCDTCRSKLEEISGGEQIDGEIRRYLDFEEFTIQDDAKLSEYLNQATTESISSILGPSDDPTKLGRIAGFEVCGLIGTGSSAMVFKAFDPRLNRFVAIKVLLPHYAFHSPIRRRFEKEGKAIASVKDQNVIPVYSVDEYQGLPFIAMQYMPDGSLQDYINRNGPLSTEEVICIGVQVAGGLAAAHHAGVIHRDVKPANVLLDGGVARAAVTDFGLARVQDDNAMTRSGSISGTPPFMSPEQTRGEQLDHRSDLFSLGSLLYTTCTGHPPFRGQTIIGVIRHACETDPRPIQQFNPDIPTWLVQFVQRLMSKSAENRFGTAAEVAEILAAELSYLRSPNSSSKPDRTWMQSASKFPITKTMLVAGISVILLGALLLPQYWTPNNDSSGPTGSSPGVAQVEERRVSVKVASGHPINLGSKKKGHIHSSSAVTSAWSYFDVTSRTWSKPMQTDGELFLDCDTSLVRISEHDESEVKGQVVTRVLAPTAKPRSASKLPTEVFGLVL